MARPEWVITPEIIARARELSAKGLTRKNIAECFGITDTTLYAKMKVNDEFSRAIKEGKGEAITAVADALFKKATIEEHPTAMIFWLKSRAGWYETRPVEVIEEVKQDGSKALTIIRSKDTPSNDTLDSRQLLEKDVPGAE